MKVVFDIVRIGKIRKDRSIERVIEANVWSLKQDIRSLLKDRNEGNTLSVVMVIPARGCTITIDLRDIGDENLKKELKQSFPNSIYKGRYSLLLDNIDNRIFRI